MYKIKFQLFWQSFRQMMAKEFFFFCIWAHASQRLKLNCSHGRMQLFLSLPTKLFGYIINFLLLMKLLYSITPIPLVLPSLKMSLVPTLMYSTLDLNRHTTVAFSLVFIDSLSMRLMQAV